jgi:CPA1 family monovalent cation:H+ antiporter
MDTPYRSLLLVCTIVVIIGTLVLQGLSLPWVIRRLGVAEDHTSEDRRERAKAHTQTNAAINRKVDELCESGRLSDRQATLMRKWASLRDWRNWDDDDQTRAFGQRLSVLTGWRRSLLGIERSVIVSMRNDGELSEDVLLEMQHDLDLEEALLERRSDAVDGHLDELPSEQETRDEADRAPVNDAAADDGDGESIDTGATVDDADVSALLMDEQSAQGTAIGRTAGSGKST